MPPACPPPCPSSAPRYSSACSPAPTPAFSCSHPRAPASATSQLRTPRQTRTPSLHLALSLRPALPRLVSSLQRSASVTLTPVTCIQRAVQPRATQPPP